MQNVKEALIVFQRLKSHWFIIASPQGPTIMQKSEIGFNGFLKIQKSLTRSTKSSRSIHRIRYLFNHPNIDSNPC